MTHSPVKAGVTTKESIAHTNRSASGKSVSPGHVMFLVPEAKAFQELLKLEKRRAENFDRLKSSMIMPRNPVMGDLTPRDGEGVPIVRSDWSEPVKPCAGEMVSITGKIGVDESKYMFLGNSPNRRKKMLPPVEINRSIQTPAPVEIPVMKKVVVKSAKPIEVPPI